VGLQKKQQGVRRNMQIEIDETMEQESAECRDGSGMNSARKMTLFGREAFARIAKKNPQEC
jgi:hypothetical protein